MNFSILSDVHTKWRDILVIGKTMERNGNQCHIVGMTLAETATLYIIEPYREQKSHHRKGVCNQRRLLKEYDNYDSYCYLDCSDFYFGSQRLQVQNGIGGFLKYYSDDYGIVQVFFDMMSAGWTVPQWLKNSDWNNLQYVALTIANVEKLPNYTKDMPISITHRKNLAKHILEKTVTLHIGKSRSFHFTDSYGDKVQCHINSVTLIDPWKTMEEKLKHPNFIKSIPPEELEEAIKQGYAALEQSCPKGMYYIGITYECSKNLGLGFYSKEFLKSQPKSSACFGMMLKPDKEIGTNNLPLKGCVIDTPVSKDTSKISAELFHYFEENPPWTEIIP